MDVRRIIHVNKLKPCALHAHKDTTRPKRAPIGGKSRQGTRAPGAQGAARVLRASMEEEPSQGARAPCAHGLARVPRARSATGDAWSAFGDLQF